MYKKLKSVIPDGGSSKKFCSLSEIHYNEVHDIKGLLYLLFIDIEHNSLLIYLPTWVHGKVMQIIMMLLLKVLFPIKILSIIVKTW